MNFSDEENERLRERVRVLSEWRPLSTAPKGKEVRMRMKSGSVIVCALKPGFTAEDAEKVFTGWLPLEVPGA